MKKPYAKPVLISRGLIAAITANAGGFSPAPDM
jgi:hypothetical protein